MVSSSKTPAALAMQSLCVFIHTPVGKAMRRHAERRIDVTLKNAFLVMSFLWCENLRDVIVRS